MAPIALLRFQSIYEVDTPALQLIHAAEPASTIILSAIDHTDLHSQSNVELSVAVGLAKGHGGNSDALDDHEVDGPEVLLSTGKAPFRNEIL